MIRKSNARVLALLMAAVIGIHMLPVNVSAETISAVETENEVNVNETVETDENAGAIIENQDSAENLDAAVDGQDGIGTQLAAEELADTEESVETVSEEAATAESTAAAVENAVADASEVPEVVNDEFAMEGAQDEVQAAENVSLTETKAEVSGQNGEESINDAGNINDSTVAETDENSAPVDDEVTETENPQSDETIGDAVNDAENMDEAATAIDEAVSEEEKSEEISDNDVEVEADASAIEVPENPEETETSADKTAETLENVDPTVIDAVDNVENEKVSAEADDIENLSEEQDEKDLLDKKELTYKLTMNASALQLDSDALAESDVQELVLGEEFSADIATPGETVRFKFVPEETGYFYMYSTGDKDTYVTLYDANGYNLTSNDDGGYNSNFSLWYGLNAGEMYYYDVRYYNSDISGTIKGKIIKSPILKVEAGAANKAEGDTQRIEDSEGTWEKYINLQPESITVYTASKVYEGSIDTVRQQLEEELGIGLDYSFEDDQNYNNEWEPEDHEAKLILNEHEVKYTVHIIKSPILTAEADDLTILKDDFSQNQAWVDDENGGRYEYYNYYNIQNINIKVSTADKTYEGYPWDVTAELFNDYGISFTYYFISDQNYGNEWEVGDHKATVKIGNHEIEYNVHIIATPFVSVEVEDLRLMEGDTYTYYEGERSWEKYNTESQYNIKASTVDKTYEGSVWEITDAASSDLGYSISYSYKDDQSYSNPWGAGDHEAKLILGGYEAAYTVHIIADPILSVEVDDFTILESNHVQYSAWLNDENGGHEVYYNYYYVDPKNIKIITADKTYEGYNYADAINQLCNDYDINIGCSISTDQSYDNVWGVGDHKAKFKLGNHEAEYTIHIIKTPFLSVEVQDLRLLEGNTYTAQSAEGVWEKYNTESQYNIKARTVDKTYEGSVWEIASAVTSDLDLGYYIGYSYEDDQSYSNPWGAGDHQAKLILGGFETTYTVSIIKNPIVSIEVDDLHLVKGDCYYRQYYDGSQLVTYPYYSVTPKNVLIKTDSKEYEGTLESVTTELNEDYGVNFIYSVSDEQTYTNPWDVGSHEVEINVSDAKCTFNVIIADDPVESIVAHDCEISRMNYYITYGYDPKTYEDVEYKRYSYFPIIEVKTSAGEFRGSMSEVLWALRSTFGLSNNYQCYITDDQAYGNEWGIGTHQATLHLGSKEATFNVNVSIIKATGVGISGNSISGNSISLSGKKGESVQMEAIFIPDDTENTNVTWSSSDTSVATVDSNGLVQLLRKGIAKITTRTEDGGFTADCSFTVTSDETDPEPVVTYTVTAAASTSAGGTVSGGGTYESGKKAEVKATAASGYKFVRWTENGKEVSTSAAYSFTVSKNTSLTAVFEAETQPAPSVKEYKTTVENGTATPEYAKTGATVTIKAAAAPSGKVFDKWTVITGGVTLANSSSETTTFTMGEAQVKVAASYKNEEKKQEDQKEDTKKDEDTPKEEPGATGFVDVKETAYYANAVDWAVEKGITNGTSATTFSPDKECTRGQIVTFLYRAAGSPEVAVSKTFSDVKEGSYYEKAVTWAVANKITTGTSPTTFSPNASCTRAQAVTFMYRAAGSPDVALSNKFTDVPSTAYYAKAVAWAVENGITNGTSATTFSPNAVCKRGQIVTFLYRSQN